MQYLINIEKKKEKDFNQISQFLNESERSYVDSLPKDPKMIATIITLFSKLNNNNKKIKLSMSSYMKSYKPLQSKQVFIIFLNPWK